MGSPLDFSSLGGSSEPMLLRLEIECNEGVASSIDGRPDRRLEVLVRYCFDDIEFRDGWSRSAGTAPGLGTGVGLTGCAIGTAAVLSAFCFRDDSLRGKGQKTTAIIGCMQFFRSEIG